MIELFADKLNPLTVTCSKSTIETLKKIWNMFKVNFEHVSHLFLVFLVFLFE